MNKGKSSKLLLQRIAMILAFTLVALLVALKFKASFFPRRPTYIDSGPDIDQSKLEGLDKGNIEHILQNHGR